MKKITAILTSLIMTLSVICQTSVFAAFSDVGDDNTYKDAITTLTKLKVIDGYEDGTFKPDGQITRAEFTKLIVFILGCRCAPILFHEPMVSENAGVHKIQNC